MKAKSLNAAAYQWRCVNTNRQASEERYTSLPLITGTPPGRNNKEGHFKHANQGGQAFQSGRSLVSVKLIMLPSTSSLSQTQNSDEQVVLTSPTSTNNGLHHSLEHAVAKFLRERVQDQNHMVCNTYVRNFLLESFLLTICTRVWPCNIIQSI